MPRGAIVAVCGFDCYTTCSILTHCLTVPFAAYGCPAVRSNLFKAADAGIGYNGPLHSLMELLVLQGGGAGRQMLQDLHVERQGLPARMTIPQLHDKLLTGRGGGVAHGRV